jgi:hypothetical protein
MEKEALSRQRAHLTKDTAEAEAAQDGGSGEEAERVLETYEEEDGGQQDREVSAAAASGPKRGGTPPQRERPLARSEKPSEAVPPPAPGGQP